ncbi:hypothetical protein [Paraburkholderia fungorum]|uniref:hypothetical protein n=1 Tax=Paraburkholderia fungorum TaxID=134537 RepID=UPI0038BC657A
MDWNPVYKWQSMHFQSAVHDKHAERHVPDRNAVPHCPSLFDMTLVLTVGFSLFELAVELLRIESLNDAMAFVAATAMWTTLACSAEIFIRSFLLQFYVLFGAGSIASVLMLVSHITLTPLGMCLYTIDTLGKCAVVMLAFLIRSSRCIECFDQKIDMR